MSRVLVVANETVEADELLAELRRIEDEHSSIFRVVAPAVAADHGLGDSWNQAGAIDAAQARLDRTLAVLRGEGLECDGWVGDMVPFAAVRDALDRFDADLIVISTHPAHALALAAQGRRRAGAQALRRPGRAHRLARARAARASSPARVSTPAAALVDDRDGAAARAAAQALEALGDAVEIGQVRDDVGQHEPPVGRQLHERGELDGGVAAAVVAALDALVGEELDGREGGLDADGREPDDDGGAARAQAVPGEPHRLGPPDDLEGVVDAAAGQLAHGRGRVVAAGVDRVRRAARERELEHRRIAVDGDDRARAREHEAGDDLLPDAAAADHRGPLADARPRDVAHGADAGHRAAAEQRGLPQRHVDRSAARRRRRRPRRARRSRRP